MQCLPEARSGIRGVIFDLDGTLVDSGLDFAAMRNELGFPAGIGLLEHIETLDDPAARQAAHQVILKHELAGAARATWMPGARELVHQLHAAGVPLAILTRNAQQVVEATLDIMALPFDPVLTREHCPPKPKPDGLLHIARCWGIAPSDLVYVGDFRFDIEAARNAKMRSCLYRNARNGDYAHEADWVIEHFEELRAILPGHD